MFKIDTGHAVAPVIEMIPDWFRDDYGSEDPDERRIVHDYAYHLIGEMLDPKGPRKVETVRRHMLAKWGFLKALADMHPDVFDEFFTTYAERVQRL